MISRHDVSDVPPAFLDPERLRARAQSYLWSAVVLMDRGAHDDLPDEIRFRAVEIMLDLHRTLSAEADRRTQG